MQDVNKIGDYKKVIHKINLFNLNFTNFYEHFILSNFIIQNFDSTSSKFSKLKTTKKEFI